jgi:hypothetical protein
VLDGDDVIGGEGGVLGQELAVAFEGVITDDLLELGDVGNVEELGGVELFEDNLNHGSRWWYIVTQQFFFGLDGMNGFFA